MIGDTQVPMRLTAAYQSPTTLSDHHRFSFVFDANHKANTTASGIIELDRNHAYRRIDDRLN